MLTRLEVDGFKNLLDFSVDLGPLTCIAGPNGAGKSNLFDAIRFLSLLADRTLTEAALAVRGSGGIEGGDIRDLFWCDAHGRADRFRIAAEMIVEPIIRDDFGREAKASSTFLRYDVEIGYESSDLRETLGRLVLYSEKLQYITQGDAATHLRFPHSAKQFREQVVQNSRRKAAGYISVLEGVDGQPEIMVHQDGGSRGPGQRAPAITAPRTIVGTSNTSVTPTILAARREMQQWRFLALEPSAMRRPDRLQEEPFITSGGGHLPATLYRLVREAKKDGRSAEDVYADITNRLAQFVPVEGLELDVDEVRQLITIMATEQTRVRLPAASLSDGTLRFLTLAVLVADPSARGLLCIEEPENGIHPAKMPEMVRLLKDLSVDPHEAPGAANPLRQVIVATHSPAFVQLQERDDLLFALETRIRKDGKAVRALRCAPMANTWRATRETSVVGKAAILDYLSSPPEATLTLEGFPEGTECASVSS